MPEGDTVFLAATRLNDAIGGRVLTGTDFRVPHLATVDLTGHLVESVVSRGKHLLFRFAGGTTLHTHYKMQGSWHVYRPGQAWRGPHHEIRAILTTDDRVVVGFRLPVVQIVPTAREDDVVGHLGPDPLAPDWDASEALRRLRDRAGDEIGAVLLDQRVIAGPGNVYKSEVCFLRGVHPRTPVADVADPEGMVSLLARLMQANRTTGMQITTGDTRRGRMHWVYGRTGDACRRCNTRIRRQVQDGYGGERATFWCPGCQPDTMSGRFSAPGSRSS